MKSNEIKLQECTSGLGSAGTNRRGLLSLAWTHGARIWSQTAALQTRPQTENAQSLHLLLRPGQALLKNIALTLWGSWPCSKCILADLGGKSTCPLAQWVISSEQAFETDRKLNYRFISNAEVSRYLRLNEVDDKAAHSICFKCSYF